MEDEKTFAKTKTSLVDERGVFGFNKELIDNVGDLIDRLKDEAL